MTAITPANLLTEIQKVLGDWNDEKRKAADLRDLVKVGMPVRINDNCRSTRWRKAEITKVGRRSFEVTRPSVSETDKAEIIRFNVLKCGNIYQHGMANTMSRYNWKVEFDCESIDAEQAHRDGERNKASQAMQLDFDIKQLLYKITPRDRTWHVSDETMSKLERIKAILGE